jgi:hypothetical protein
MPERQWDPDLSTVRVEAGRVLGVKCGVMEASIEPGQPVFKLASATFVDEVEAKGQHMVYVDVLDESGHRLNGQTVEHGWPWEKYPKTDEVVTDTVYGDHLAQWGLYAGYDANKVEFGPYWVRVRGNSDVFYGMGLPWNRHVSYATVFQLTYTAVTPTPDPPVETPVTPPGQAVEDVVNEIRNAAWAALYPANGVNYNPNAAFARYARDNKMGAPCTQEKNYKEFRYQGYTTGIVCARVGQWNQIIIIPW